MHQNSNIKPFNFIDIFSGAGGFSLGFSKSNFCDLFAIEKNEAAAETYRMNFPSSQIFMNDVRFLHSLDIQERIKNKVEVVLASPPCEPFTSANPKRKNTPWKRFYEDQQGDLIFHAIRIIGDLRPRFFIIENVLPIAEEESKDILQNEFLTIGYENIHFNYISAENHGCPSIRNRIFISNIKLQLSDRKKVTVRDILCDLPPPNYPNNFQGHFLIPFSKQAENKALKIQSGSAAIHFSGAKGEKRNWIKLDENDICPTIMGKSRFIHPVKNRPLTVREQARLMSFPDTFIFSGSIEEMFNQIGESVPPIISQQIAVIIKNKLQNKK